MMGAVSSAGGHYVRQYVGSLGRFGQISANAVFCGTIEEIGGGKFANGAVTGAFSIMFNDMMHSIKFRNINWAKVRKKLNKLYEDYTADNNSDLYRIVGGEIKDEVLDKYPQLTRNACALKLCIALESAGFYIPNGTPNTLKAANGMNYFVSAQYFYEYLNATYSEYKQVFRNVYEMKQKFNTGIYYQGNRQNGQPGGHIDVRYNGYYGHMYKEFKTNVGFY